MKRVLQLVTRDEPGGVRVLAETVAEGLRQRGHVVETVALRGEFRSALRAIGGRHDAILSYQVAASLVGSLLGWCRGVRVRATHLTAIPSAMRPGWRVLDRQWGRVGLHTAIVANSRTTESAVAAYPAGYRARLRLIRHGVRALPAPSGFDWRAQLRLAPDRVLLVASGRLVEQKDHATAVRALAGMPEAQLAIAGEGPLRASLTAHAAGLGVADRLHLVGNLDAQALADLLAAADLYLFPSVWESFGLAGVEAAMAGVPVLASDLPVLREVLAAAEDMAGFHWPGSSDDLVHRAREMLGACPGRERREASAAAVAHEFAIARMIDAYCRLIDGAD